MKDANYLLNTPITKETFEKLLFQIASTPAQKPIILYQAFALTMKSIISDEEFKKIWNGNANIRFDACTKKEWNKIRSRAKELHLI